MSLNNTTVARHSKEVSGLMPIKKDPWSQVSWIWGWS